MALKIRMQRGFHRTPSYSWKTSPVFLWTVKQAWPFRHTHLLYQGNWSTISFNPSKMRWIISLQGFSMNPTCLKLGTMSSSKMAYLRNERTPNGPHQTTVQDFHFDLLLPCIARLTTWPWILCRRIDLWTFGWLKIQSSGIGIFWSL